MASSKRFDKILIYYPIPGQSRLPCDSDFGLIERKWRKQETITRPSEFTRIVREARQDPEPFQVVYVQHAFTDDLGGDSEKNKIVGVRDYKSFLGERLLRSVPGMRDFRGLQFAGNDVIIRKSMMGECTIPISVFKADTDLGMLAQSMISCLPKAYFTFLPLKREKYNDVMFLLSRVYLPENVSYYETLCCANNAVGESDLEDE